MNLEAEAYIERFEYLRNEFKEAIHQKSPDDLIWKPTAHPQVETNSAYVLVTHVAGSEAYHIHELVGKIHRHLMGKGSRGKSIPTSREGVVKEIQRDPYGGKQPAEREGLK